MSDFLNKNYFEVFDIPVEYTLDLSSLRDRFREVQRVVHPDKFSSESSQVQRLAAQNAAHANQAFQTLKDPITRGFCVLTLLGYRCADESETINDSVFLMRQIDFRERLEVGGEEALLALLSEVELELGSLQQQVAVCLKAHAVEGQLNQAESLLKKMQFYNRLVEEIESKI